MKSVRIFLGSPGDVAEERKIVTEIIEDLQLTIGKTKNLHLELIKWETHSFPDTGKYAQDVINKQIGEYSIFIGVMWQKFGSKTLAAESGTEEEFNNAYDLNRKTGIPKILFYFKTPGSLSDMNQLKQMEKVFKFKQKLGKLGALYAEYNTPREFNRKLMIHLYQHLDSLPVETFEANKESIFFLSHKSQDRDRVEKIYRDLYKEGLKPWMSSFDILPGESWKSSIEETIKRSEFFILFISKNSGDESETGFSWDSELSIAEQIREIKSNQSGSNRDAITIIPVKLDDVEMPDKLEDLQYFDLSDPSRTHQLIEKLVKISESKKK